MADWDDENFEPIDVSTGIAANRWEGEDEDDEVKESWEDEDEEKKLVEEKAALEAKEKVKKKTLQEKIAEKERLKQEEQEKRLKEQQEEDISPEEVMRRQKESDLSIALETTFGVNDKMTTSGIDTMCPVTKEDFQEFSDAVTKKIAEFNKSEEYPLLAENLIRNICVTLNSFDLKKVKTTIDNLYLEKQKIEKGDKARKSKGKGKAKLKMEGDNLNQYSAYVVDDYDDYNDFM